MSTIPGVRGRSAVEVKTRAALSKIGAVGVIGVGVGPAVAAATPGSGSSAIPHNSSIQARQSSFLIRLSFGRTSGVPSLAPTPAKLREVGAALGGGGLRIFYNWVTPV